MRPETNGIVLTERKEFVVIGQAFSENENSTKRLKHLEAITIAMGHLSLQQYGSEVDKDPEWYIPYKDFETYSHALQNVDAFYLRLRAKTDRGSYCENPSPECSKLTDLLIITENLWGGLLKGLGVPQK